MTLNLDALEALARAATPGPWAAHNRQTHLGTENAAGAYWTVDGPNGNSLIEAQANRPANSEYLAALSPDVVLALIAELRAARADLAPPPKSVPSEPEPCPRCGRLEICNCFRLRHG